MSREPPSLGMFAGTDRSLAAPMAIVTLALSTSENAQTGLSQFLHLKMCKSRRNLKYEIVHCENLSILFQSICNWRSHSCTNPTVYRFIDNEGKLFVD